jgi:GGDEF domain-containing protein
MSYAATRRLVLAVGLGVLLLVAAVMFVRRVDTVEVVAVLLFIPVFLAFVLWDVIGGLLAGVVATVAYAVLRQPAIDAVGDGRFFTLVAGRALGYVGFGLIGGWADRQLERSLEKLDVYDQVDDATGLFNARFFLQDTDLEMARAARYKTLFSVCVVEIPAADLEPLGRRKQGAILKDVGRQLAAAVRSVDRAVHARADDIHHFAVICPETGQEGARIFADRLADQLGEQLRHRGVPLEGTSLARHAFTYPSDDDHGLDRMRASFAAIERLEHPEHPADTQVS